MALIQSYAELVEQMQWLARRIQTFGVHVHVGQRDGSKSQPSWVIRDNKWRATRYGLEAIVITDAGGSTAPLRDELYELSQDLQPVVRRLGCAEELDVVGEVRSGGASYERQHARPATGGGLTDVVDALVREFAEDRFVCPGEE